MIAYPNRTIGNAGLGARLDGGPSKCGNEHPDGGFRRALRRRAGRFALLTIWMGFPVIRGSA